MKKTIIICSALCGNKRYENCLGMPVRKFIATFVGKEYAARNSV